METPAQIVNYVNNPSFEIASSTLSLTLFDAVKFWGPIDSTSCNASYLLGKPPIGPVPYCSTGFQYPKTGNNFVGSSFFCDNCVRWYLRNRLKKILKPNTAYCAKYHVVNTNNNRIAIDSYGMYFGSGIMDTITQCMVPLTYLNPQIENTTGIITDTLNWIPITGTFVANGTEKYMVLGNFKSNAATNTLLINTPTLTIMSNDVYIDDVSLIELNLPAFAGRDTVVLPGSNVFLGREPDIGIDEACIWYKWPNMASSIDTVAGFWINPTSTSTYVVKQQLWCNNSPKWDTVIVKVDPTVGIFELDPSTNSGFNAKLELFPNPANSFLELKIKNGDLSTWFDRLSIYNSLGRLVREESTKTQLNIQNLPEGVYFLELKHSSTSLRVTETVRKRFVVAR